MSDRNTGQHSHDKTQNDEFCERDYAWEKQRETLTDYYKRIDPRAFECFLESSQGNMVIVDQTQDPNGVIETQPLSGNNMFSIWKAAATDPNFNNQTDAHKGKYIGKEGGEFPLTLERYDPRTNLCTLFEAPSTPDTKPIFHIVLGDDVFVKPSGTLD